MHTDALQIFLYYDELEICNPLGSKVKIHKLGMYTVCCFIYVCMLFLFNAGSFYFTLGNLSPKYRSKLSSIYLVALVKSKFISIYGMDAVLKPFIDDIKKLVRLYVYSA